MLHEAHEWVSTELTNDMQEFYLSQGYSLDDNELMLALEARFGDRIVEELCVPYGLHEGTCLIIAAGVARKAPGVPEKVKRWYIPPWWWSRFAFISRA